MIPHGTRGSLGSAVPDSVEHRDMLAENILELRPGIHQRQAMQLHPDRDVILKRIERLGIVVVVGRLRDRSMKREINVVPMLKAPGRIEEALDRGLHGDESGLASSARRVSSRIRLEGQAELEAPLDVRDRLDPGEAERVVRDLAAHECAGSLPREDEAILPKPAQRFADDGSRYAVGGGKLVFPGQPRIRGIFAGRDPRADLMLYALDQRRGRQERG